MGWIHAVQSLVLKNCQDWLSTSWPLTAFVFQHRLSCFIFLSHQILYDSLESVVSWAQWVAERKGLVHKTLTILSETRFEHRLLMQSPKGSWRNSGFCPRWFNNTISDRTTKSKFYCLLISADAPLWNWGFDTWWRLIFSAVGLSACGFKFHSKGFIRTDSQLSFPKPPRLFAAGRRGRCHHFWHREQGREEWGGRGLWYEVAPNRTVIAVSETRDAPSRECQHARHIRKVWERRPYNKHSQDGSEACGKQ